MFDYSAERERRAHRFERHLDRLVQYRLAERTSDCALVFSIRNPAEVSTSSARGAAKQRTRRAGGHDSVRDEAATATQALSVEQDRFVQLAFMKRTFYLDLPTGTLASAEAEELLSRPGYFRLRDRRWWFQSFEEWAKVVRLWNPIEKEYLNEDARSAAEELAHLFYDVWRYPLETRIYWQAFALHRRKLRDWEGLGRLS